MVLFNYSTREITAKVVYYGPGLCGKTTNLQFVHSKLDDKTRGKMISLATESDRTLFFDFLPINLGTVRGMKVRFQLYTVPGQVFYNATRKLVLRGVDAVVFVADSQAEALDANKESFQNLRDNLRENGFDPDTIPVVMQWNKRDLPNCLPIDTLNKELNEENHPWFEAEAINGKGVLRTLQGVGKILMSDLMSRYDIKKGLLAKDGTSTSSEPKPTPRDRSRASAPLPKITTAPARASAPVPMATPAGSVGRSGGEELTEHLQRTDLLLQRLSEEVGQIAQALFDTRSHQEQLAATLDKLLLAQDELRQEVGTQRQVVENALGSLGMDSKLELLEGRTDEILRTVKARSSMPMVKDGFWARRIFDI